MSDPEKRPARRRWFKPVALQSYRLAVLVIICWLIRDHHVRLRVEGDRPIAVTEAQFFWTNAASIRHDHSALGGMMVYDPQGVRLGYLVRTLPDAAHIIGYSGTTDTIVALDERWKVKGINIRASEDTIRHAEDVMLDWSFKRKWNGQGWSQVAGTDLMAERFEGVAGATMTSTAVARGIVHRFRVTQGKAVEQPVLWDVEDIGLIGAIGIGLFLTFTKHRGRAQARKWFQWYVIGYVGFLTGDLLAQSLLAGWAKAGIAWTLAPGLVLLVGAALVIPWATKRPLYCQQICPHGAVQEIILRTTPRSWRLALPQGVEAGLRWGPGLLLGFIALLVFLPLEFDLAGFEPFDAYLIGIAGTATIVVALVGLGASVFVPKAYCKFGCPTGSLLEFVRSHGSKDGWGRRDWGALVIVLLVAGLKVYYGHFHAWLDDF
jgi:NosR/NirI family transcriptional regulator, nitrous oxide reductase regulator